MKIYIASHCAIAGRCVRELAVNLGHKVVSTWLDEGLAPTEAYPEAERRYIAARDAAEVLQCDLLIHLAGPDKYSGGKFVETGLALGLNKRVIIVGRRENMLMWHPLMERVDNFGELKGVLRELGRKVTVWPRPPLLHPDASDEQVEDGIRTRTGWPFNRRCMLDEPRRPEDWKRNID